MEVSSGDFLYSSLILQQANEEITKQAIQAELAELLPVQMGHVDDTAAKARKAQDALDEPQKQLEDLRADLAEVERAAEGIRARIGGADRTDRVRARGELAAWEEEAGQVQAKIAQAEADLVSLAEVRNETRLKADSALGGLLALQAAQENPFTHRLAQSTAAYEALRKPQLWQVILREERTHPEYGKALEQLEFIASSAGFKLVDDNSWTRQMYESYRDAKLDQSGYAEGADGALIPPAPGGMDIVRNEQIALQRRMEDQRANERIEDHRIQPIRIPVSTPIPARPELKLPWKS